MHADSSLWQLFSFGRKQIKLSNLRIVEITEALDKGLEGFLLDTLNVIDPFIDPSRNSNKHNVGGSPHARRAHKQGE